MDEDVGYIWTFKEVLWCEIEERCRNNLNFHILKKARFFEVQFHIIPLKAKVWQVSPPQNIYKGSDHRQNYWLGESSRGENDAKWVRCWRCQNLPQNIWVSKQMYYLAYCLLKTLLLMFDALSPSILNIDVFCPFFYPFCPVWGPPLIATLVLKLALKW